MRFFAAFIPLLFVPAVNADMFNFGPTIFNTPIPALGSASADIVVPGGFGGFTDITDIDVFVDILHVVPQDLTLSLLHVETGTVVELFDQYINGSAHIDDVTFDDEAPTAISSANPFGPGSFQPQTGFLSDFDGEDLAGTWRLTADDILPTGGTIVSFGISGDANVSGGAAVPEPSSFAMLFAGGLGFFARRRRQKKTVA
jgi:hypothetical protein